MNTALDRTAHRFIGIIFTAFLSVVLPNIATATELYPELSLSHAGPFPEPPKLQQAVRFWQNVFSTWSRRQVALHDAQALGVVYEVFTLPGFAEETQSDAQRVYVEMRRRLLIDDLRRLESRLSYQLPLDARLQQLLAIVKSGGENATVFGASERVRSQRGMRERFRDGVAISGRYDALMRKAFRDRGLPEDLAYLPHVESSFQSRAQSFAGAAGAWQFMPATGRLHLNMNTAVDERYDPILAARGAARYLADAYERLGDWGLAVTSYNHGVAGMLHAQEQFGNDIGRIAINYRGPAFGFASRNFYAEFLAVRGILHDLPHFFPEGIRSEPALDHERIRLPEAMRLGDLARFFGLTDGTLSSINPALTNAAISERCAIPAMSEIWLPRGTLSRSAPIETYQPAVAYLRSSEPRLIKTALHQSRHGRSNRAAVSKRAHRQRSGKRILSARKGVGVSSHKRSHSTTRNRRIALR